MKIREIRIGGGSSPALCVEPHEHGCTVVPLSPPLEAERLARAIREALGSPRRETLREEAPVIEIQLQAGVDRALVQDDAAHGRRALVLRPAKGEELVLTTETHMLQDAYATERLLLRVAGLFKLETAADLLPALAHGGESLPAPASPKEIAYQRAFQEMRAIAKQLESIDRSLSEAPPSFGLRIAAMILAAGALATVLSALFPRGAALFVGLAVTGLLIYLLRAGKSSLRELQAREALPEAAAQLRPALEAARERVAELAATLRKRGEDPDEVLERWLAHDRGRNTPSVLAREQLSSAVLLDLEQRGAQTIVFVPAGAVAGDDFGGRVRRPKGFSGDGFERSESAGE